MTEEIEYERQDCSEFIESLEKRIVEQKIGEYFGSDVISLIIIAND